LSFIGKTLFLPFKQSKVVSSGR